MSCDVRYAVVATDEEQYSIWEADRALPGGRHVMGFAGTKDGCVAHNHRAWTDMRPRSLRVSVDGK